jgi:hypothetical protein
MGLRPIVQEEILSTLIKLKGSGLSESTLRRVSYELSYLAKRCDLDNPDDVNSCIASMKGANSYKDVFVKTYNYYAKIHSITWNRPTFKSECKLPRIPTKEAIIRVFVFQVGRVSSSFAYLLFPSFSQA